MHALAEPHFRRTSSLLQRGAIIRALLSSPMVFSMARITVEDCLNVIPNRFDLVLMASKRARQLAKGADPMLPAGDDKPTVLALREIAANKITDELLAAVERQERERAEREALEWAATQVVDDDLSKDID